jgi:hypothetical protein
MYKIHAFTGDNATSNDTQTAELQKKNNSFDTSNHVRCFNHTIQLSCKALLKPFSSGTSLSATDNNDMSDPSLEGIEGDDSDEDSDEPEDEESACNMDDDPDDDLDELEALSGEEQVSFLEATAAVKETVTKVSMLSFTYMLPPYITPTGSKTFFCNYTLDHNRVASVASNMQGQSPQAKSDPTGRCYAMELHVRYATICCHISDRH